MGGNRTRGSLNLLLIGREKKTQRKRRSHSLFGKRKDDRTRGTLVTEEKLLLGERVVTGGKVARKVGKRGMNPVSLVSLHKNDQPGGRGGGGRKSNLKLTD